MCPVFQYRRIHTHDPASRTSFSREYGMYAILVRPDLYGMESPDLLWTQSHDIWSRCLRFAGVVSQPQREARSRPLARLYRGGLTTRRIPDERSRACDCPPFLNFLAQCQFNFIRQEEQRYRLYPVKKRSDTDPSYSLSLAS